MPKSKYIKANAPCYIGDAWRKILDLNDEELQAARQWYWKANAQIRQDAETLGIDWKLFAAVVAAISPGRDWQQNIADARMVVAWWQAGKYWKDCPIAISYSRQGLQQAWLCLTHGTSNFLTGDKVVPFYETLVNPLQTGRVVVDYHMANLLTNGTGSAIINKSIRQKCEAFVRLVALVLGVEASAAQAIGWQAQKKSVAKDG